MSGKTARWAEKPTYLLDEHDRVHFEKEAFGAAVRHVLRALAQNVNVLHYSICQPYPNSRTLAYRFVQEHPLTLSQSDIRRHTTNQLTEWT